MNWMELLGLSGFEDFEQVELTELKKLDQKHRGHVLKTGRRFVAAMLAAAMILPSAAMAAVPTYPPQVTRNADGTSDSDPHIEIESNFVHDDFGFLTNTLELAIRVQSPMEDTGEVDKNGNPILVPKSLVQTVSVNLAYDTQMLHPVSWEWVKDDRQAASYDVDTNVVNYYDAKLETQKDSRVQTAAASTGIVDTTVNTGYTVTENVANGDQGLLYFTARAFKPEPFAEMTTIAVIRFAVEDSLMEHIEIKKNKTSDDYTISYDGTVIEDVIALQNAMTATLPLVEFAQQKDIEDAEGKACSLEGTLLYYSDDFTQMNYIPGFDHTDSTMTESVTRPINGTNTAIDRPNTAQSPSRPVDDDWEMETLTLARDEATDTYSYTTNLIYKDNVKFTVVSKRSFVALEDMLDKLTTIVYVDWDNTILGTQIVPKRTDVRGLVSDYVAENFIYHDDDANSYDERFDLNDPEQIATAESKTVEEVVSSLERKYNYRGKYPATGPMGLDSNGNTLHDSLDTVVNNMDGTPINGITEGSKYPLTNKLDYVFFKRPMVHTDLTTMPDKEDDKYSVANDPDGSIYQADYNEWFFAKTEWSQKMVEDATTLDDGDTGSGDTGDTGTTTPAAEPYWDVEHPYAYGWALCTVDNYEDVWTTLGMGELGSSTLATEAASLAAQAGSTMGYSGASAGGYQDLNTAQNTIASVTYDGDAAFAFADLEKGFTDRTVFLKAVYEPGTELIDYTNTYRLYRDPYYNKLNTASVANGGAYKLEMIYERSNMSANGVVGTARMREPSVRQDTTTDMRWESLPSKGVTNDDMINATDDEAYLGKDKTTYTNVTIPNSEVTTVTLVVSGRQNKVDYYLMDAYAASFVAGTYRSEIDSTREDGTPTLDNYSYYAEGADIAPYYATSRYSERAGTRGFVLYGTLENLMEAATKWNNGIISDEDFEGYVSIGNLQDANICVAGGTSINLGNITAVRTAIKNAAADAQAAYANGAGDAQWWDVEHNHASLTYHQLQHYIINGALLPDAPNELEGDKIAWCRLHEDCANLTSAKPTDWPGLISAAQNNQKDNITLLTATQIETYFKLRGPNAALWTAETVSTFADKVIAAVAAGAASWDQVQYYLINDTLDPNADTYGQTHYWWYDDPNGATTYSIGNWTELMGAARDARVDVTLPDGSVGKRTAKLSNVEDAFNANAAAAAASAGGTDPAWVAATENLCVNNNGEPFASFTDFTGALANALDALEAAGYTSPDWWQVQYVILGGNAVDALPHSDPNPPADYAGYWWHNGGAKIVDIPTLLKAGRDKNDAALELLTAAEINAAPFGLRKSFKGEEFTDADMDDFIAKIKNVPTTVNDWSSLQYYLIHDNYDASDAGRESSYYWWVGGGSATPVVIYTTDNLITAAFLAIYNGNTKAWDDLTTDQVEMLNLRLPSLVSGEIVEETFDALPKITDLDTFKTDIANLIAKYYTDNGITHTHTPPARNAMTWYQIQKWLITKEYDTTTSEADLAQVYWWKDGGNNPNAKSSFDKLIGYLQDYVNGDSSAIANNITADLLTDVGSTGFYPTESATTSSFTGRQVTSAKNALTTLVTSNLPTGVTPSDLTWDNIQYAILHGGAYGSDYYEWNPTLAELDHVLWAMVLYQRDGGDTGAFEGRITADRLASNGFWPTDSAGAASFTTRQVRTARTRLITLLGSLTESEIFALKWGQVQYALLNGAYTTDPADYDNYSWDPTKATRMAAPAMFFAANSLAFNNAATLPAEDTATAAKTTTSEDGLTTTVTTTQRVYDAEENTLTFTMTDVTTVIDGSRKIVTTVERVLVIDLLTGESTETVGKPTTEIIESVDETINSNHKVEEEKKEENSAGNTGETDKKDENDKKDEVYTIAPDTDIKTPEKDTASSDTDNTDDSSSQPVAQPETVPKDTESTVPAQEKAEADVPMNTEKTINDDNRSQSTSDPPASPDNVSVVRIQESVTDLRTMRTGPTRFRASPQRSPWIRFPASELLPTLTNRRITA